MFAARSLLYIPGNREHMLAKAPATGADAVVLDLEDSVPADQKETARQMVAAAVREIAPQVAACLVRINGLEQGMLAADIAAAAQPGLSAVVLPKPAQAADIAAVDAALRRAEADRGLTAGAIGIVPIFESALGIANAYAIAAASPRVVATVFAGGRAGDLAADLGYEWSGEGLERVYARSRVHLESRAAGVGWTLDGVYFDPKDAEGLRQDAEMARRIGYRGKTVIHPAQAQVVNELFTPRPAEVELARETIAAFQAAEAAGSAAITVRGQLVDYATIRRARALLALADLISARRPPAGI